MVIEATGTPLEVILTIQAFDIEGKRLDRLVYLDTNTLAGKQLTYASDRETAFEPVQVGRYYFAAQSPETEALLREFLPQKLHELIVVTTSKDPR